MKPLHALPLLVMLVVSQASAQNVGIGTTTPQADLHIAGTNPVLRLENNGSILILHSNGTATNLQSISGYSVIENRNPNGGITFRPGPSATLSREVMINSKGIAIGPRDPNPPPNLYLLPNVPLDIRADGEVVRIAGTNPYISIFSQGVQRGYIQGHTGGLELGSNNSDVNIWTNGNNRLSVKNNGALAIAGNAGSAGQVLTSSGPGGSPYWGSSGSVIYNNFRFFTQVGNVSIPRNGQWYDIPALQYSFTLGSNHYVDVSALAVVFNCSYCPTGSCRLGLFIDGNQFTIHWGNDMVAERITSLAVSTGFILPAGNHTIQWRMACGGGNGDSFTLYGNNLGPNSTHMKVWMVPQ